MKIRFKYDYEIKVKHTCCFSGHQFESKTWVLRNEERECMSIRPSWLVVSHRRVPWRGRFRTEFTAAKHPQRSDITLLGKIHPDVMIDVPNDIFEIIE